MPTPTDILMFAPKELRGTVATLVGDLVDRSDLFKGLQDHNKFVKQMDPIAQAQQDRGLPIPSGGKVVGKIAPKTDVKKTVSLPPNTARYDEWMKRAGVNPLTGEPLGAGKAPSAKDSAQTSYNAAQSKQAWDAALKKADANPGTKVTVRQNANMLKPGDPVYDMFAKGAKPKASDITSRAPKDPRLPLKDIQAAQGKAMEMARKGNEAFDKKWGEWGKKQGIDPAKAAQAARDVWTQAAMRNLPEPTEQQMKYLISLMRQRGEI